MARRALRFVAAAALAAAAFAAAGPGAAAPPGTPIANRGEVQFVGPVGPSMAYSNEVSLLVAPLPSTATLTLLRADASRGSPVLTRATQCISARGLTPLPPPTTSSGEPLALGQALPLSVATTVHGGEAVFLELVDPDRNSDASRSDVVELVLAAASGDVETVVLEETAADSGRFVGYLQTRAAAGAAGDCVLQVTRDTTLEARYTDPQDAGDTARATALVDPFSRVFDSRTGAPVNGARVRLVEAATGAAATVLGDDGTSRYPAELVTGQPVTDSGGSVYAFPPGVFRFPLVTAGNYRLVIEPPASYAYPSAVAATQLQALAGAPFRLSPASFDGALTIAGQAAPAVDVPLDPMSTTLFIDKTTPASVAAIGDYVPYSVTLRNAGDFTPLRNVVVTDSLPPGMRYRAGSGRIEAIGNLEPEISANGSTLTFRVPELPPAGQLTLRYVAVVGAGTSGTALVNRVVASADNGIESNAASATVQLREELFRSSAILMGRVIAGTCDTPLEAGEGVAGVRVYLEDGRYAITDDEGKYHFEGLVPGSHVAQLDAITLPPELAPLRCDARVRSARNALSQFVDLRGGALATADFVVARRAVPGGDAQLTPPAMRPSRTPAVAALEPPVDVADVEPGIAWVQPRDGFTPGVPSLRVAIAHLPQQSVRLAINGHAVSDLNFEGAETSASGSVALSRWRGVDLRDGDNTLVATVLDAEGTTLAELTRQVRYGGGAVRAELVTEESLLTADGRTQPVVALRVFDAAGQPARPGTLGAYRVDPPYRSWWEVETLHDNPLLIGNRREPTFAVDDDGLVRIVLEPTAQTGNVVVRLRFNERQEQEIRAWLEPEQRDWILVGVAEGTAAYNRISDSLEPPDVEDGYTSDGRVAFFAKGRIKGSTLLTVAFDSERERALAEERLFGTIEPDRYYTLYGDAVEQRFEAASTSKLYLKIERAQFAALFGDFDTGFTITELGRYSRNLTGLKADFAGERYGVSAFAAENREAYGRDELRGDGTSGPYRLSRSPLVANSDRLRIEVRDRIRSEVVVESRLLTRFIDYSLDYLTGIVTFKEPVPSRDGAFNPVYVVAEYETLDASATATTAGARATTRLAEDKLELGATLVDEGGGSSQGRLAATDLRYRPTGALELRAEIARSASKDPARDDASAYLAEVEHVTERVDLQAYAREQEQDFGVGQQLTTEAGTRKIGVDARVQVAELWTANGEAFRQSNLETGADRELVTAEARRETDDTTASIGLRRVVDSLPQTGVQRSELFTAGGSVDVLGDRVTLRALTEQALNQPAESFDFPELTTFGIDYHLTAATTLFTEIEDASGAQIDSTMTRVGVRSSPWNGTQVSSSVNRELGEYGPRVFANVGLTQSWQIGEAWAMDVGVDQSETVAGANVERFDAAVPPVSGNTGEDFLATFAGGQYRADVWTFTSRLERRDADLAERWAFIGGFYREPIAGRALSLSTRWLDNATADGDGRVLDARFSYAYRPHDSRFIVLERLDLEHDERDEAFVSLETARFVNNLNLHWQVGQRLEVGTQIGARYVRSTIDGARYSGWSSLLGVDLRRELTPTLDVGLHGTWLASAAAGTSEHAVGIDVGINAARNVWISVGYNFAGFDDDDFDASRYTAVGPYVRFRFKADQDTFKDLDLSRLRPR